MSDSDKTREELVEERSAIREQVAQLQVVVAENCRQIEERKGEGPILTEGLDIPACRADASPRKPAAPVFSLEPPRILPSIYAVRLSMHGSGQYEFSDGILDREDRG
jgi:hypothetical protein